MTNIRSASSLTRIATVTLLVVAMIGLYWPTWVSLAGKWSLDTESYSHGALIAVISLGLIFRSGLIVRPSRERYRWVAPFALLGTSVVWLAMRMSNIMVAEAVLLPVLLLLSLAVVFGLRSMLIFGFPVAYFYFAIPVWNYLTRVLQTMTIEVVDGLIAFFRIPAIIDGSLVILPNGTFEIASGCAGLHFLVVGLAVGTLYAWLSFASLKCRLAFVLAAIIVSILTNWIRVTTIIVAGYLSDMQHYLVAVDHYVFGWVLFVVMLLPLFYFGRVLETAEERDMRAPARKVKIVPDNIPVLRHIALGGLAVLLLAIVPMAGFALDQRLDQAQAARIELPDSIGGWRWQESVASTWQPWFPGARQEVTGRYTRGDQQVELYVNLFSKQSQGAELVNGTNRLFERGKTWESNRSTVPVRFVDGSTISVIQIEAVGRGSLREYYIYWYLVADKALLDTIEVKYHELRQRIKGQPSSGIVAVRVECQSECAGRLGAAFEFLEEHGATINRNLFVSLERGAEVAVATE